MTRHSTSTVELPAFNVQHIVVVDRNWDGAVKEMVTPIGSGEQAAEFIAQVARDSFDKQTLIDLDMAFAMMMTKDSESIGAVIVKSEIQRWTFELTRD